MPVRHGPWDDTAMVCAIVLAAGESRRMGRPKAGLRVGPGGPTFAAALVQTLRSAGLADVTVVAGAHPDAVRGALAGVDGVEILDNPDWPSGQLSSLLTALAALEAPELEAVVVGLVDSPFVRPATVRLLLARWRETGAPIVRPALDGRHGHPVLFARETFADLRAAPRDRGAKAVFTARAAEVLDVVVDDPGVLADIDTPDDYDAAVATGDPHE
jgi:molybdenum cofactor cytidylyltransferase